MNLCGGGGGEGEKGGEDGFVVRREEGVRVEEVEELGAELRGGGLAEEREGEGFELEGGHRRIVPKDRRPSICG